MDLDRDRARFQETLERYKRIKARENGAESQNGHAMPELSPEEFAVVAPVAQKAEIAPPMRKLGVSGRSVKLAREKRYEWLRKHQYGLRRSAVYVAEELIRCGGQRGYSGTQTAIGQALGMHRQHVRRALDELVVAGFVGEHHRKGRKRVFFRFRV